VGKAGGIVKAERKIAAPMLRRKSDTGGGYGTFCNHTTRNCIFSLDTTRAAAQNPRNFFRGFPVEGIGAVKRKRFAANGGP
jgi:hypothetical protein